MRFKDLEERLVGISPKTLSDDLKKLQTAGLIERTVFNSIPPKVEYKLSEEGIGFRSVIIPLIKWAAKRDGWINGCSPSNCVMHPKK